MRAWVRLVRVSGRPVRAIATQVREHGLSLAQFRVLPPVACSEGGSRQALANKLLVTQGNTSYPIDRLAAAGLVERRAGRGRARRQRLPRPGALP